MHNGFTVYDYMRNNKAYDGNTLKFGIAVDNEDYIVKHAKDTVSSLYSEHLASRFIRNLGIPCHETYLGYYNGQMVVILKDFTTKEAKLRSYKSTRQSSEGTDLSGKAYTYKDVLYLIGKHTKMSEENKRKTIIQFWDMFICDAILGNRDRHHGNWGYLACKDGYIPAPIYDNGASLFPDLATKIGEYKNAIDNNKDVKDIIPYEYKRFYILIVCTRYLHMIERKSIKQSYVESFGRLLDEVRQW